MLQQQRLAPLRCTWQRASMSQYVRFARHLIGFLLLSCNKTSWKGSTGSSKCQVVHPTPTPTLTPTPRNPIFWLINICRNAMTTNFDSFSVKFVVCIIKWCLASLSHSLYIALFYSHWFIMFAKCFCWWYKYLAYLQLFFTHTHAHIDGFSLFCLRAACEFQFQLNSFDWSSSH